MAQKGLFFNAFPNDEYETGYDRNYSADDISNWLKAVITTGIIKTDSVAGTGEAQGLKVLADNGFNIKVNVGMAVIDGKPYINNSTLSLTLATAPTSGTRYDCVILRMNNTQTINARLTSVVIESLDHTPTEADLTRTDNIYDLLLGYVVVNANVTAIQQTNITDTRGDGTLCPWTTSIKGYEDYYDAIVQRFESDIQIEASANVAVTDLAVSLYNDKYSLISVYCNGLREDEEDYSIDTSNEYITIRFTANKSAGAEINVILENFIDGEGLQSVLEQYNDLVEEVESLKKVNEYNYYCNGINDNVLISNLVKSFINSNDNFYKTLKLNIIGSVGIEAPAGGDGTDLIPYKIFDIGSNGNDNRWELDFTNAGAINFQPIAGKSHIFFDGACGHIIGLTLNCSNNSADTSIKAFSDTPQWLVENSRFALSGYKDTFVGYSGTFINCKAEVHNENTASWCFYARENRLLSIIGGEYTAYTKNQELGSAVVCEGNNCNVVMANVNAPTNARSGEYQTHAIYQTAGELSCFGLVSALPIEKTSDAQIFGTIAVSVPNQCY